MWTWALEYLACPACFEPLSVLRLSGDQRDGLVGHQGGNCREAYPVIGGVPRLLLGPSRQTLYRNKRDWFVESSFADALGQWAIEDPAIIGKTELVRRFDEEWRRFAEVGTDEQARLFEQYFDLVPEELLGPGRVAIDAGCGAGRWANEVQRRGSRVIAVDLGLSIELAERNTRQSGRVTCVQADVRHLPIRDSAVDLTYSLGVLHHIADTQAAVLELARVTQSRGTCLVYLYYALEDRPPVYRALFSLVNVVRSRTAALPQPALVMFSTLIAGFVYWPLARLAILLERAGLKSISRALPLSFYGDLSFTTMRNDSLDRFGTRLEKRFTRAEIELLLERAGFTNVRASEGPPKWRLAANKP